MVDAPTPTTRISTAIIGVVAVLALIAGGYFLLVKLSVAMILVDVIRALMVTILSII